MKTYFITTIILLIIIPFCACKKNWLDAKPDKSLVVPTSLQDMQALLNNTSFLNARQPSLGEVSCDDYYITYTQWQKLVTPAQQNAYVWSKEIYDGGKGFDWSFGYSAVFYCNNILQGLTKINPEIDEQTWHTIRASAVFFRSVAFFNLLQLFSKPYFAMTAESDFGIPLKVTYDISESVSRASVQQCYDFIITEITSAIPDLPELPQVKATQPSKAAAYGMLSRVYLMMEKYDKALTYSDSCLRIYSNLINYNSYAGSTASYTFPQYHSEQILYGEGYSYSSIYSTTSPTWIIDSLLYKSYSANDLRKQLFFKTVNGLQTFRGSYSATSNPYTGLATDEIYLIRSEANARVGNITAAMSDLNTLLQTRWKTGTYAQITASTADEALQIILRERRKELIFRGLRWNDLKRLNKDPKYAKTLTRILDGKTYTLPPNDPLYVLPIPDDEIQISGIQQNIR